MQNGVVPEQKYHPKGKTLLHALAKATTKDPTVKEIIEITGEIHVW